MSARAVGIGVDLGTTSVRVALCRRDRGAAARLVAVAERPAGAAPATALRDAWRELATRERRCVVALAAPDAALRVVRFPRMPRHERLRAAALEARRFPEFSAGDAVVRIVCLDPDRCAIGVARRGAVAAVTSHVAAAGLRAIAVDDAALALLRALPGADVVVDVGYRRTLVIAAGEPAPDVRVVELGSAALTAAIVAALGIDDTAAERRKRTIGLAGAGEHARDALVEQVTLALAALRAKGRQGPSYVALTGGGARLPGLADALHRAAAVPVRAAELAPDIADAIPHDILRAGAPEWALAYGLALHAVT